MDALQLMMALFLTLSEPCNALPIDRLQRGGEQYQVLSFQCGRKQFRLWERFCPDGQGYWSRPFLLEEKTSGRGFYMNRFGEIVGGWAIEWDETYMPGCGA